VSGAHGGLTEGRERERTTRARVESERDALTRERDSLQQQMGEMRADLDTAAALVPDYRQRRRARGTRPPELTPDRDDIRTKR
jgi:hypothetical protein